MMDHHIELPLTKAKAALLKSGDAAYLTGVLYTARDAAHKRLVTLIMQGKPLPFPIKDSVLYYVGPTPAKPGQVIGSAGPTTSYRMDAYAPTLITHGLTGMIGKGKRGPDVINAIKDCGAVYFAAIGGAGALLAATVKEARIIAFEDLGPEAIHRLVVENFPVTVVIDTNGEDLYETGRAAYLAER